MAFVKIELNFFPKVHPLIRRKFCWKSRGHRVAKTNLHVYLTTTSRGCPNCVYCVRQFCVKNYDKIANSSSRILGIKIPITTLACYDVYNSCKTFDHLSFTHRMRVNINERPNGSPVIYFQIRWGFLSVHNAFKVLQKINALHNCNFFSFL